MTAIEKAKLPAELHEQLKHLVLQVYRDCPGQSEYRYISRLEQLGIPAALTTFISARYDERPALHLQNLPIFDDVQLNKIMALAIGDSIGRCVAYSDYNQSYITDVRPSALSREVSSDSALLPPHSDLAFASDVCRPRHLVLVGHREAQSPVKTLLAPADLIAAALEPWARELLRRRLFEVVSGMKLAWPYLRIDRIAVLGPATGRQQVRFDVNNLKPAAELEGAREEALRALGQLSEVALELGRQHGVALARGEALLISNDHCLHGRDEILGADTERFLLRAYVLPSALVARHHNRMIALSTC